MKCNKALIFTGVLGAFIIKGFDSCTDSKENIQETRKEIMNIQFTNDVPVDREYKSASIPVKTAPKEALNNRFMVVEGEKDGEIVRDTLKIVLIHESQ